MEFSIITAVDKQHLRELEQSYYSWVEYKQEFRKYPIKIIYDSSQVTLNDLKTFKRNDVEFIPWDGNYKTQREKMLTALTVLPAQIVDTTWYLKIDTDTFALNNKSWVPEFDDSVFITNHWGSTKPANAIETLDDWADKVDYFKGTSRLNLPYDSNSGKIKHSRIISWLFFGQTKWTNEVTDCFLDTNKYQLPFPSQDTCLWYCAMRKGYKYRTINFKELGFEHRKI